MSTARTLAALGAALAQEVPALTEAAVSQLSISPALPREELEDTVAVLIDRLCLSLTLAKPIGLRAWAEREGQRLGRAAVFDVAAAATRTVSSASDAYETDHGRLHAFLDVLAYEIERAVLGSDADDDRGAGAESVTALLAMLGERDYGTCCHSKATAEWAKRLATAMGCDEETVDFIGLCALLHDIGKISTPDGVLLKAGPLTSAEWEVMRDHAAGGARILNQIASLQRCAIIVRAHHERFDGGGYPDGLAGTSIPFEARIVAVADAFHAMISERPYRRPIPPRQALQILGEGRGSQWDPQVVDAMAAMFNRRPATATGHQHLSSA